MNSSTSQIRTVIGGGKHVSEPPDYQGAASFGRQTDSGYASQGATPASHPPVATPLVFGKFPSESIWPLSSRNEKKERIVFSDLAVDKATTDRFTAIRPHFEKLLLEYVRKGQKRGASFTPISTRLLMIGSSKEDAVAEIAVFCHPDQRKRLKKFAKLRGVTDLCQPDDPGEKTFRITVFGNAPMLLARLGESKVAVIADHFLFYDLPLTLCGTRIILRSPSGQTSNATVGGVIKIVTEIGDVQCYGMTVGHALQELYNSDAFDDEEYDNEKDDSDDEDSDDNDSIDTDDNSDISHDPSLMRSLTDSPSSGSSVGPSSWGFLEPLTIGEIVEPSMRTTEVAHYYDWALFRLLDASRYELNKLLSEERASITLTKRAPGETGRRSVCMMAGHTAVKKGHLLPSPGRIVINPGRDFVDSYMITIDDGIGICEGDSGSWVVDADTFELYGHLVASDMFDSGYVIPFSGVSDDIKREFRAQSVTLPSMVDIFCARYDEIPITAAPTPAPNVPTKDSCIDSGYSSNPAVSRYI
ncbi:hypothetical protein QQZ08_002728 [Neonectria magnoliae]|uniref:Uncharacterized protein n=1 Tax=Neonectria magnoliae TaxID=2732573 RepID=A0ABR1ICG5_9HYPO